MYGWGDPLAYLEAADGADRMAADKIIEAAQEIRMSEEKRFWRNLTNAVASGVAQAFKA